MEPESNKKTIVEGGCVPLLISLIKTNDIKLQNEAVGCLRNLSMDGMPPFFYSLITLQTNAKE